MQGLDRFWAGTMEADLVRTLMSGNDAQCFTTARYEEARDKWIAQLCGGVTREALGIEPAPIESARSQLRAFPLLVEVGPDLWTLRELAEAAGEEA